MLEDALWLLERGVFVESERGVFRSGMKLEPGESLTFFRLRKAIVLGKLGRGAKALALFEEALDEDPNLEQARYGRDLARRLTSRRGVS